MQRHSGELKGHLEQVTAQALATGSAWALVAIAFVAAMPEGLETAVFLLATCQASEDRVLAQADRFRPRCLPACSACGRSSVAARAAELS